MSYKVIETINGISTVILSTTDASATLSAIEAGEAMHKVLGTPKDKVPVWSVLDCIEVYRSDMSPEEILASMGIRIIKL